MAPNGYDIWLSGGLSFKSPVIVTSRVDEIRTNHMTLHRGPDLPKPLAAHCHIFIDQGQTFIYGGITSVTSNATTTIIQSWEYSNDAYIWINGNWSRIPQESPCSNADQDLAYQQPCAARIESEQVEIAMVTFSRGKSCTSVLNLFTYAWSLVDASKVNIPIGGHLVTSVDKSQVFYLGGLYYTPQEIQSFDVYQLVSTGWKLTNAKLQFGISSNETKSYPSTHNVTFT